MELIGTFNGKVYETSDKKKLKKKSETYSYGTISIRDSKLTPYANETVIVKVYRDNGAKDGK